MLAMWVVSLVAVGIFALGLSINRIENVARNVSQHAYQGIAAMTNTQLTDDDKELTVRRAGISLFIGAWSIFWRFSLCFSMTYVPIFLADRLNIANEQEIFKLMLRPGYIIIVSLALIAIVWLAGLQRRAAGRVDNAMSYNMGERIIHMIAFSSPMLQRFAARCDDAAFRLLHRTMEYSPPIFITSVARGGTTALLNAFSELPSIATHTYRDMPFITAPYLWRILSAPFKRKVVRRERAHGDGIKIDLDSPEAFDEVYWKLYWPEKYDRHRIGMWQASDHQAEGILRLQTCFQKITHLQGRGATHYLSKNNANIARLGLIQRAFPGAQVIMPVRRPAPHAASLFRQHLNFLEQHSNDDFILRYMHDIGHLEFGLLHTPIAFRTFENITAYTPDLPDYWLEYWIAAFRDVIANIDSCHVVLQDDLRSNTNSCMQHLLGKLDIDYGNLNFTHCFRREVDETDRTVFSPNLLAIADSLYAEISRKALR